MRSAFGRRLTAARLASGFETAADMARELGLGATTYRKYERGENIPEPDVLAAIVKVTGQSLDWLILGVPQRAHQTDNGSDQGVR